MRVTLPLSYLSILFGVLSIAKGGHSMEWTEEDTTRCGVGFGIQIDGQGSQHINDGGIAGCKATCESSAECAGFNYVAGHSRCYFRNCTTAACQKSFQVGRTCYTLERPSAEATGDPHFTTWSGRKYDFHGICDLVLVHNPGFQQGLGLDIHVRTKQLKTFAYISSAVLQIGNDSVEVMGDIHKNLYWINKQQSTNEEDGIVGDISGYDIRYQKLNSKQHEFVVDLGHTSIAMKTYKKFVHVSIKNATESTFGSSSGLFGAYGTGELTSRDGGKIFEDTDEFGREWQVLPAEGNLFHNVEGPQAPKKCEVPLPSNVRRRLAESDVSEEEARIACANVDPDALDICVFDVMATGDKDVVGAY